MAKCPICKEIIIGFEWTKTKNGKNWLADKEGNWHDCPKSTSKFESKYSKKKSFVIAKANEFEFCDMCDTWLLTEEAHINFPERNYISMLDHLKIWHPNGEILDEIDFMVPPMLYDVETSHKETFEEAKSRLRNEWGMSILSGKYTLVGKTVSIQK